MVDQFNDVDAFGQFLGAASRISEQHESMHAADIASMYIALTQFVGAVYPDHLEYVDRVLQSCCAVSSLPILLRCVLRSGEYDHMHRSQRHFILHCSRRTALMSCCLQALKDHSTLQDDRTERQIVSLLTSLLTAHEPVTVLGLSTYPEVMSLLKADAQKVILRLLIKIYWSPVSCMAPPAPRWSCARVLQEVM